MRNFVCPSFRQGTVLLPCFFCLKKKIFFSQLIGVLVQFGNQKFQKKQIRKTKSLIVGAKTTRMGANNTRTMDDAQSEQIKITIDERKTEPQEHQQSRTGRSPSPVPNFPVPNMTFHSPRRLRVQTSS
jgi:hypothetical protein